MEIAPFALERYFAKHEFTARYLLSSSDCESLPMAELVAMADAEARGLWDSLKLGYTESYGHPLLREAIAGIYSGIGAQNILVSVPEEAIFLLMHALLKPGDHVVCTFPGYQSLFEVARSIGCELTMWTPIEEAGWRFDVAQLKRHLRANTRLVVANFPHNPTGYLPSAEEYQALIELVSHQGCTLLSDEMFRFLEVHEGTTLPSACERYERAISLFGLSKSFGLPGLRVGWLATQDQQTLEQVAVLKDYTTICHSAPSEILALIAVRRRQEIFAEQRQRLRRNLQLLDAFFAEVGEILQWNRPRGSSVGFPRLRLEQGAAAFCRQLVEESGILLVPSTLFDYGDQHLRIGFGREDLPAALERFSAYLDRRYRGGR